jgi:hypothetical protein
MFFTKCHKNDQVKEDEIARTSVTHGGDKECMYDFSGKATRIEDTKKTKT